MSRTTVSEDPALTKLFPRHLANRVTVTLSSGETFTSERMGGPGTLETPMTDDDFERKFRRMAAPHIGPSAQERVLGFVADLAHQTDYAALFDAMSQQPGPR
jgi:2-methylcitrate dehydratase